MSTDLDDLESIAALCRSDSLRPASAKLIRAGRQKAMRSRTKSFARPKWRQQLAAEKGGRSRREKS